MTPPVAALGELVLHRPTSGSFVSYAREFLGEKAAFVAGLYSTGRIVRSMSVRGSAPRLTAVMSSRGVPYGGILLTFGIALLGVVLIVPALLIGWRFAGPRVRAADAGRPAE